MSKVSIAPRHAWHALSGWRMVIAITAGMLTVMAIALLLLGREPWCTCGYVKLWHAEVISSENSQHLFDWYSFTHVIHGFIFYWVLWLVRPRMPARYRFIIALVIEILWEVFENTTFVINRYRTATLSLDYYGDSIVNSIGDVFSLMLGYWMSWRLPAWVSMATFIVIEIALLTFIRDNLLLNVIMLLYPISWIKNWQIGP